MASNTETRKVEIIANGTRFNATLKEMAAASRLLQNELAKLPPESDKFAAKSQKFQEVRKNMKLVKEEMYGTQSALQKLGTAIGPLAAVFSAAFVGDKIISFFTGSSTAAKDFEKALSSLSSITGAVGEDLAFYEQEAAKIGATTTLSASQAVKAFEMIGSSSPQLLSNKEALAAVTKEAVTLAEAAGIELPEAAGALSSAMNQFNLPAEDASRIINSLAAGSLAGSAGIAEVAASFKNFGVVAATNNVSVEESVALTELLADKMIKGSEAGTALRNVLNKMATAEALPREALERLEQYGVNTQLVSDKTVPLNERLREFSKISGDATAMAKVFGTENLVAGQIILGNIDRFDELTSAVTGTNTAYEQAATNTNNLWGDTKALESAYEALQIGVGGFLNQALRPLIQGVTALIIGLAELPKFLRENWDLFAAFGIALVTFNATQIAATASTIAYTAAEKARAVAVRATAIAQGLLNAAQSASPMGLILKLVGLLVAGFVLLYNRSETVRGAIAGIGEVISSVFSNFSTIWDMVTSGNWSGIGAFISESFEKGRRDKLEAEQKATNEEQLATQEEHQTEMIAQQETHNQQSGEVQDKYNADKLAKEKEHQEAIAKAREEYQQAALKAEKELEDLRVAVMEEGLEKELASLALKHERELQELEVQRQAVLDNIGITEQEKQALLTTYREQQDLLEAEYKAAKAEAEAEEREAKMAEEQERLDAALEMDLLRIENEDLMRGELLAGQFDNAMQAEMERENALLTLKQEYARKRLDLLIQNGQGETEEALRLKNEILSIEKEKMDNQLEYEAQVQEAKKQFRQQGYEVAREFLDLGVQLLEEEASENKRAAGLLRNIKRAQVISDGIQEVAAIWRNSNSSPMNILVPGSGAVIAAGLTAAAITRTTMALRKINATALATGGATGKKVQLTNFGTHWGLGNQRLKNVGTFKNGGHVGSGSVGVIGEAGAEWVGPNWMLRSPKYANIFGYLESERVRAKAFETGGTTAMANIPTVNEIQRSPELQAMQQRMEEMIMAFNTYADKVDTWARNIYVINDPRKTVEALEMFNQIESDSAIRR